MSSATGRRRLASAVAVFGTLGNDVLAELLVLGDLDIDDLYDVAGETVQVGIGLRTGNAVSQHTRIGREVDQILFDVADIEIFAAEVMPNF